MGSLRIHQDHVTITVEWPYGALTIDDFATTTKAMERIYKAIGDPQSVLMADALEYDAAETEAP